MVYVDQFSKCRYLWLQQTATVEETLTGKKALEQWTAKVGVTVQRYYADNGVFKAKEWVDNCTLKRQQLTSSFSFYDFSFSQNLMYKLIF